MNFRPDISKPISQEREQSEEKSEVVEYAPEGWMNNFSASKYLGFKRGSIEKIASGFRESHSEWFQKFKHANGQVLECYHPDLIVKIKEQLDEMPEEAPEGWKANRSLSKSLSCSDITIQNIADEYRLSNPGWFRKFRNVQGKTYEYYHPDLVAIIDKRFHQKLNIAPKGWETNNSLSAEFGTSFYTIRKIADEYRENHHEWFQDFMDDGRRVYEHYHPDLVSLIREKLDQRPEEAPEGWMTNMSLSKNYGFNVRSVQKIADEYRTSDPDWFRGFRNHKGQVFEHYHPNLVAIIKEKFDVRPEEAPNGWMTNTSLADECKRDRETIKKITAEYRESHPEWFRVYLSKMKKTIEHYHPALVTLVKRIVEERSAQIPEAPTNWMTVTGFSKTIGASQKLVHSITAEYRESHPEWFQIYLDKTRKKAEHYHPDLISVVIERLNEIENQRPEKAPLGWRTNTDLAKKLEKDRSAIKKIADEYRESHPEWFQDFRNYKERVFEYYHPDLVYLIQIENGRHRKAPEGWMTLTGIFRSWGISKAVSGDIVQNYREDHPEWFQEYQSSTGRVYEHYHPDLIKKIRAEYEQKPAKDAPEGWMSLREVAEYVGIAPQTAEIFIADFLKKNEDKFFVQEFQNRGKITSYYSPEVVHFLKQLTERPPVGWLNVSEIARELKIDSATVRACLERGLENGHISPTDKAEYKGKTTRIIFYSPDAIEYVKQEKGGYDKAPEGWLNMTQLVAQISIDRPLTQRLASEFINSQNNSEEFTRKYKVQSGIVDFYSPEVVQYIKEKTAKFQSPPEGWFNKSQMSKMLKIDSKRIYRLVEEFFTHSERNERYANFYKPKSGALTVEFYSPEVVHFVQEKVNNPQHLSTQEKLVSVLENPSEISRIQSLVSLFGSAQSIDILYVLHPEYQGIPVEKVKSILAEYLGDYLLTPAPFVSESLKGAEALFGTPSLMEGLSEVIKRDALDKVLAKRESNIEQNITLFREYFDTLRAAAQNIGSPELMQTILTVEKFYISILSVGVPEGMVDGLKEGREFPDIYQRINIREIEAKKRLLIADEMGVGKSASAILAKEHLGVEMALVVVPSNAIDTWQGYLSDMVDENGKRVGYFKEQPRVLRVTDLGQLEGIERGAYDYVIISHERLTAEYTQVLGGLDYGMLIVDEVHKFKNLESGVRAEHLLRLAENKEGEEKYVAMLSGTPVPNKVEDVAMLLKLMYPERFAETDSRTLTRSIIHGDLLDIRQLLLPRLQMKSLGEHLEMPTLTEQVSLVELTSNEEEIYQVLLDEDELTPTEKMQMLQKFLLNPRLLDITPGVPSSKLTTLNRKLQNAFSSKDRAVLFVNDYISNVIRGESSILQDFNLPVGVEVRVIHGGVTQEERLAIQDEFQRGDKRILLIVSGKTADVAVDYSAGQEIIFYNEPWTIADKHQQQARVYRPGIEGDVESRTLLTKGTIEEGKHEYIQVKHRAIEKLLKGIPITEVEMEILEKSEEAEKADLSVNPELADYYFSSFEKMNRIFASVKEIGEKKFSAFLEKYGAEYADCYRELGSRSYQSNASRVVATVLEEMVSRQGIINPRILDLASGPEMLRRHSKSTLRSNIVSLDINPEHFANKTPESETIVGSFTHIPLEDESVDYVNLSLALHYTKLVPSKGEYERLEALKEMSRVLKPGGRAVVNMIYSLDFRDTSTLTTIAEQFGLELVEEYSGEATSGEGYQSRVVTLEKRGLTPKTVGEVLDNLSREDLDGFKLQRTGVSLKDSRKVLSRFTLGARQLDIELNEEDQALSREESNIFYEVEALKTIHGSVQEIPKETIIERGFVRIKTGRNKYILFKKIPGAGAVIAR